MKLNNENDPEITLDEEVLKLFNYNTELQWVHAQEEGDGEQ